jgi:predicted metalloendopeptidase
MADPKAAAASRVEAWFRVNGSLSDLTAFADAFACSNRDAMVRSGRARCEVW